MGSAASTRPAKPVARRARLTSEARLQRARPAGLGLASLPKLGFRKLFRFGEAVTLYRSDYLFVHLSVVPRSASHTGLPHYSHHAPCIPMTRTYANTPPPPHACLSCLSSVCLHCRRLQGVGLRTQARPAPRIWQRPRSSPLPPRHAVRLLAPSVLGHTVYRLRLRPKPVSCGPE